MKRVLLKFLPLIVLLLGAAIFVVMVATRQPPEKREIVDKGPLVEAIAAPAQTVQVLVEGQGTVRPADQIDLVPQVPGIVVWKAPDMEPGGFFSKGDLLLRIDPADYELAVTRAEATVARARYQLDLAREEAEVAREEWERIRESTEAKATDLVLRIPQVRAAEAELQAAAAGLDEARLRLARTEIHAPFSGRVRSSRLDVGQFVNANQPVAQVYGIERAEIVVPVQNEEMRWFDVPMPLPKDLDGQSPDKNADALFGQAQEIPDGRYPDAAFPDARVRAHYAGRLHEWEGKVTRAQAELDTRSRMMHLVVEVNGPYSAPPAERAPLLVGMFVDVEILGTQIDDVRVLPRHALREGNKVWVVDRAGLMHMRAAQVVRVRDEEVLARLDVQPGEQVVVSQLSGATDGMKVRVIRKEVAQ